MERFFTLGAEGDDSLQLLWEDGERVFCRGESRTGGNRTAVLAVLPAGERVPPASLDRLAHEYALKDELDGTWAVRPLELRRHRGRPMLVLEDPGGEPLDRLLGAPMEVARFLRLAMSTAAALGKAHQRGLIHKDLKPTHILVNRTSGDVKLTGFGIASRLPRERSPPEPPETIAGTLAYMAPEQTGRMNRSIDARSDLYALGVTFYQMLTGALPFAAADPMEWVHCHIARRPVPPAERLPNVPAAVSAIILKLLAKTPEDRYQTAAGVESDLRHCLVEWEREGRIGPFPLGERDTPDRLLIPEKLYGRAREIATLLAAFDRVIESGAPEMVLVSGYPGIGKSAVVNELHKALVPPRGLFASGKFDQYKRDVPYATLAQAFQSLVRRLLAKSEAELAPWRDALREALGPNGRLLVDLVPELTLIIGDQPPLPDLPAQQARSRFQLVLRRFIGVFARRDHPLALFLDDLQWLDAATLDLLADLLTRSDLQHLMLIGAYRDNEVTAGHPLRRTLDDIKAAGRKIAEVTLAPLAREHLGQLMADALRCAPERAAPLARLVHEKTGGNPFFALQFVSSLAEEGLLAFDHDAGCWSWDLDHIHAKGYTENVVDLMVGKLARLSRETQEALQHLACLGNVAEVTTLSLVHGTSSEQVEGALWPALRQELIERRGTSYKFIHDRVQEAAYSLVPESARAATHLRIGRLLLAHSPAGTNEAVIFDIVNQLDRGAALITAPEERERLAELNLTAGQRAKASSAHASALTYVTAGLALLPEGAWERRRDLIFALELNRAECEFLTGAFAAAETRLDALSSRAADTVERATIACLRVDVYTGLSESGRAVAVGLDYLRHLGIDWSPHPTEEEIRREYQLIWSRLGGRAIEDLIGLPLMTDPTSLATLEVLTKIGPSAIFTDMNLLFLTACRVVNLSLEHGNCDASYAAYIRLAMFAGPQFDDYEAGYRFGLLGYQLAERSGLNRFQARIYMTYAYIVLPWTRHVKTGRELLHRAFAVANQIGDLTYSAYSCVHLNTNMLAAGDPLIEVQREAEQGLTFARKMRFGLVSDVAATQLALIRMLRGFTRRFGSFDDAQFGELEIEKRLSGNCNLAFAECWYWIRKLQARVLAGDCAAAVEASAQAQRLLWTSLSTLEMAEYHFYSALARAQSCDSVSADERQPHVDALSAHHGLIKVWADRCPENFENRAALVGAEIARLERRDVDAMRLYQQAVHSARAHGFVQNEALAYELAARFYAGAGFREIADLHLRNSRRCYLRWGADGKVRQLDALYPQLREDEPIAGPTETIGAPVEHLDLGTVIKVSQVVSSEIVLEKLIDTLLRTAIEQAGAERGLLLLLRGDALRIEAEAATGGDMVTVQLRDEPTAGTALPQSVLQYVLRTRETVILDDATAHPPFAADPYIRERQARSILCLPMINQTRLTGVLYLENSLAPGVFAPARLAVLKLLASQAAIALENTRLYRDLAEREAKIRRLVDANIIGIFIWQLDGRIIDANDAFLGIVGYDRDDLDSGRIRWTDLTPPEWRAVTDRALTEVRATGNGSAYEKEYFRKDGSRVPVLIGATAFEGGRDEGVNFILDLTERKRAEAEARESERRYREMEMELAHANRVATMGQLTASIAHELNQPIAAASTNADAALRWLGAKPPDLEEVRQALTRIVRDADRAGAVIGRVRDLIKKAPQRKDSVDMSEAVREVIALASSEIARGGVALQMEFGDGLPRIAGDRVQLQQVVLNLVVNAVQAMAEMEDGGRQLLVSTGHAEPAGVLVTVTDSGPGLPPERVDRVFDPFYTTKPGGLGMGLSICRSIIEAHGGRLWVAGDLPRGASFHFSLPARPSQAP